ncbi:MAG: nuclear transport factor 2 family protein [Weeksellaceae bacterium]
MKYYFLTFWMAITGSCIFAQESEQRIHKLLDNWHQAAAVADEEAFFGAMAWDAHYLGTDETEDWSRDEMKVWAKKIFQRDSAWDFKKKARNIYLYEDGKLAWFDETLNTWMGVCRGSGVVVLTSEGWKIKHYVLSVAVPNDTIDAYLKLLK